LPGAFGACGASVRAAPTYLNFSAAAGGLHHQFVGPAGAPVPNSPNFMVKTIAEQNGVRMLSLFGFMGYSIAFLIPVFLLITLIFFRSRRRGEIFRDRRTPTVAGSSGETRIELDSWPLLGQDLFMRYSVAVAPLLLAQTASSASIPESGHEGFGLLLLALAGLVLAARLAGMAAERLRQPAILGELLAGVALGNVAAPLLGGPGATLIQGRGPLAFLAEMGILLLLFGVGLESDVRALARVGLSATLVALLGAITPLALGWGVAAWLLPDAAPVTHLFIGATLAATSVGITSRVLKDLGAIRTPAAQVILGAAILDDILGLVLLATVTGIVRTGSAGGVSAGGILAILLKAGLLLGAAIVLGHSGSRRIVALAVRTGQRDFLLAIGVALCFSLAFLAERLGLASILGAFAAGLILDPYGQGVAAEGTDTTLEEMLQPLEGLFAPLFFVVIGLQVQLQILADSSASSCVS